jgi:hypothetical protein
MAPRGRGNGPPCARSCGTERSGCRSTTFRIPSPAPVRSCSSPEAVGICGSELEGYLGHQGNRTPPLVMGHELAGRRRRRGPRGGGGLGRPARRGQPARPPPGRRARPRAPGSGPRAHRDPPPRRLRGAVPGARRPAAAAARRSRPVARRPGRAAGQRRATPAAWAARASRAARRAGSSCSARGRSEALALQAVHCSTAPSGPASWSSIPPAGRRVAARAHAVFGDDAELRETLAPHGGADIVIDAVGAGVTAASRSTSCARAAARWPSAWPTRTPRSPTGSSSAAD